MQHYYKYGILLHTDLYVDLNNIEQVLEKSIGFHLYKWDPNFSYEETYGEVKDKKIHELTRTIKNLGIWIPIVSRSPTQWKRFTSEQQRYMYHRDYLTKNGKLHRNVMKPMHMFFQGEDDLQQWMGEKYYQDMLLELL